MKALTKTDFHFDGQKSVYHGKVRDVYDINDDILVMVATDRISAFDVVLPKGIPFKGQVLNQIAAKFLDTTTDICPNWKLATPDPMVTVGLIIAIILQVFYNYILSLVEGLVNEMEDASISLLDIVVRFDAAKK